MPRACLLAAACILCACGCDRSPSPWTTTNPASNGSGGQGGHVTQLHQAVRDVEVARATELLQQGADPRARDPEGQTPLGLAVLSGSRPMSELFWAQLPKLTVHQACQAGDADYLALLTALDASCVKGKLGMELLKDAVEKDQLQVVRVLLAAGAFTSEPSWTPLHEAAWKGRTQIVRAFIDARVEVNVLDRYQGSPLHQAACAGHIEIIDLLLPAGAKVDLGTDNNWLPLHAAAWSAKADAARRLLDAGADVSAVQKHGWRAIHDAAWQGADDVVKLLRQRGDKADDAFLAAAEGRTAAAVQMASGPPPKDFADSIGPHPAFWAARRGQLKTLDALLDAGKDRLHMLDVRGASLLHTAAEAGQVETIRRLLERGLPVDLQGCSVNAFGDMTPLHVAAYSGKIEAARALLKAGASIEATTEKESQSKGLTYSGYTPLMVAVYAGQIEMVTFLLDEKADIEAQATEYVTALCTAAGLDRLDLCKLLLARGAKVAGKTETRTPLHEAAASEHVAAMQLLLDNGANVNAGAVGGRTPLTSAKGMDAIDLLIKNGASVKLAGPGLFEIALDRQDGALLARLLDEGVALPDRHDYVCIRLGQLGDVAVMQKAIKAGLTLVQPKQSHYDYNSYRSALDAAISSNRVDMVRFLLSKGFSVNEGNPRPLAVAARSGTVEVATVLIEAGADADARNELGHALLREAAEAGNESMVRLLLKYGAKLDAAAMASALASGSKALGPLLDTLDPLEADKVLSPALRTAAANGNAEAVRMLLKYGADPADVEASSGRNALHLALGMGNSRDETVRLLVAAMVDVNAADNEGLSPLNLAILNNHERAAGLLRAKGARLDACSAAGLGKLDWLKQAAQDNPKVLQEQRGWLGTPLYWAAKGGHAEVVTFLTGHGADPSAANSGKVTALALAAREGNVDAARALLAAGAAVNPGGGEYWQDPLRLAVMHGRTEVVKALLEAKAPTGAPAKTLTALHLCANEGFHEIAAMLIAAGADIMALNEQSMTPLELGSADDRNHMISLNYMTGRPRGVVAEDRQKLIRLLVDASLGSEKPDAKKPLASALVWAAGEAEPELVRHLLEHGVDPDAHPSKWGTPLGAAISHSRALMHDSRNTRPLDVIRMLLEAGADPDAKDQSDSRIMSPRAYADYLGDRPILDLLRDVKPLRRHAPSSASATSVSSK